ncbi:DUF2254 domain-containing protein [Legionella gresilensis]|uniref:DUF2254 domain-containing protein n=1 Tax=Legionella gresilensis TaxID=91823 RepID=UPI0013EF841E|nr:DUF2254 domain-containing protein [Legionella gresilensis]
MGAKLLNLLARLHASYWYIPLIMAIASLLLSIFTVYLDQTFVPQWLVNLGWFQTSKPDRASAILSTIATSVITVAGVVFSMTIVAVSFAASQIGPRLIANFMRDRANQVTLGTFIATFLFCLFILLALFNLNDSGASGISTKPFLPQISLLVAIILTLCSVGILIYFIHHIPQSINVSNVVGKVGEELFRQVDCLFPINIGKDGPSQEHALSLSKFKSTVSATQHGYMRIIDGNSLLSIACKHDFIIKINARPGDYITENDTMFTIYSSEELTKDIKNKCIKAFIFGHERNQEQDILFLVNELVEIIARALSPSMNDPFTAMTCMNWLELTLQKVSKAKPPSSYRYDTDNQLRVIASPIYFEELCDLTFCRTRSYICKDRNATMHMLKIIHNVCTHISCEKHKTILINHATAFKDAAVSGQILPDAKEIKILYQQYFN